jgi:predicted component of type VI protein secretion system
MVRAASELARSGSQRKGNGRMRAALIGSGGPVLGHEYALDAPVVTIGRRDENAIVVKDPTVSRKHALIRRDGDDFILVDNNSTSGVTVNGQPITGEIRLHDGDRVGIGGSALFTVQLAPEDSQTVTFSREQLDNAAGDRTVSFSRGDFPGYQAPPAASELPAAQRAAQSYQSAGDTSFVGPIGAVQPTRGEDLAPPPSSAAPPARQFTPPPASNAGPPAAGSFASPPASTPSPQLPPLPGTFQGPAAAPQSGGPQLPPLTPPGAPAQPPPPAFSAAPNLPPIAPPGNAPQFNAPPSFAPPPGPATSGPPQANVTPPPGPAPMSPLGSAPGAAQPMLAPPPAPAKKSSSTGLIIGLVVLVLLIIVALAVVAFLLLK